MKSILFATDLDNTLIHSHKHKQDKDVCVEWIGNKKQSYMSTYTYKTLPNLAKIIKILPITTRSIDQYNRIQFPNNCISKAITTNGAIMLDKHKSKLLIKNKDINMQNLKYIETALSTEPAVEAVNYVDNTYIYAICTDEQYAKSISMSTPHTGDIKVMTSGRKVYFIPSNFTKGNTLSKIKDRNNFDLVIAAGDSELDIDMLEVADIALAPASLAPLVNNRNIIVCPEDKLFSDFIIDFLKEKTNS